ncbi:hypothetical protein L1987_04172 [Smallanthus sonchifolius]|uniref:Uncharacterized protein n=1 Tax=Smallanthus sonchifolius TaxID=185202 RepID=A0ACB9KCP5_9ASTR|nr:hypothetical protein L1987_04172 [Smallanthus sonchifolius]
MYYLESPRYWSRMLAMEHAAVLVFCQKCRNSFSLTSFCFKMDYHAAMEIGGQLLYIQMIKLLIFQLIIIIESCFVICSCPIYDTCICIFIDHSNLTPICYIVEGSI